MDINTARGIAARIWCDQDYSHVVMNTELAEEIANLLKNEADEQSAQQVVAVDALQPGSQTTGAGGVEG